MRFPWKLVLFQLAVAVFLFALVEIYFERRLADQGGDAWLVLLMLAAAVLPGFLAWRWWIRPLRQLTVEVQRMAAGDFSRSEWAIGSGEMRGLERALDDLRQRIVQRLEQMGVEKSRLEVILESIDEGILVIGSDHRIVLGNQALADLFDTVLPLQGRRAEEVVRNSAALEAIDQVLEEGVGISREVTMAGGIEQYLDIHVAPIEQEAVCIGAVAVFHDITPLRRLERVRRDFVANVSHELRTPLTAIKGYGETLLDGALDDEQAAGRFVEIIATHADRLTRVLDDLLELSKLESEHLEFDRQTCKLRPLVESCVAALERQAAEKNFSVDIDIATDLQVSCAPQMIERALVNLLDNAVKYSGEGGEIKVHCHQLEERNGVAIEVEDAGIGIPSEDVDRIFERFYRVDKGRSRQMGGTGLGLSIVRHIIEAHGERVYVRSELGKGSTFGFTLALVRSVD